MSCNIKRSDASRREGGGCFYGVPTDLTMGVVGDGKFMKQWGVLNEFLQLFRLGGNVVEWDDESVGDGHSLVGGGATTYKMLSQSFKNK